MALTINTNIKNEANGYSLDASQVKGGYVVVANKDERNAIPAATKVNGTTIYQADVGKEYRWNGSEWLEASSAGSDSKLDKQTAQTESDQVYGKLADGSQTMFDVTMGATATTIPRRDTAGRIQVADGVSGNDAVNFNQLSAVGGSISGLNIQNGSGTKAIQQKQDGTTGTFDFTGKNSNATALDPTLTGQIAYGATGDFAVSFGGKSAAQGKRSVSAGTTTIAKGKYSAAFGDNSVALGNDSFTANYQNTSKGQASAAFGSETQSIGAASVTFGKGTITNNDYELACGRFNNSQSGYLFSVGCGSSDTDRRNALWIDGDIAYCRSNNGDTGKIATLSDAENQANIVITKKFLNDDIQLSQNLNVIRSLKVGPDNIFTLAGSGVLFGHHLIANAYRQTVVGRYNSPNNNAFFQVGNGDDENTRKNAFEVWSDGRAKVQTAPKDNDDVVRKLELDTKQATLVSGTNIKTINGNSLLGSGDLVIESGGTEVTPNPTLSGSEAALSALQIGDTKYRIEGTLTTLMVGIDSSLLGG